MAEILVNSVQSTIDDAAGLDAAATSVTLTDGSAFPSTGNFRVGIEDEICLCTARSGNVLTITRGEEGTTAAAHSRLQTVAVILTAGGIIQYLADNYVHI